MTSIAELEKALAKNIETAIYNYNMYENLGYTTRQSIDTAVIDNLPNFLRDIEEWSKKAEALLDEVKSEQEQYAKKWGRANTK